MKFMVFVLAMGILGNAYGDPTPAAPTRTPTPEKRILIYHTAEIYHGEVQDPSKAPVEPFIISQIRAWAGDNQIELREDPSGNDTGYSVFSGRRSKDLPGDLSLPELKEECEKFFQIK